MDAQAGLIGSTDPAVLGQESIPAHFPAKLVRSSAGNVFCRQRIGGGRKQMNGRGNTHGGMNMRSERDGLGVLLFLLRCMPFSTTCPPKMCWPCGTQSENLALIIPFNSQVLQVARGPSFLAAPVLAGIAHPGQKGSPWHR